jgi:hypothetical protein
MPLSISLKHLRVSQTSRSTNAADARVIGLRSSFLHQTPAVASKTERTQLGSANKASISDGSHKAAPATSPAWTLHNLRKIASYANVPMPQSRLLQQCEDIPSSPTSRTCSCRRR